MGLLDWIRRVREEERYEGLGDPEPGVQIFSRRDWKADHIERYCELAAAAGYHVELASPDETQDLLAYLGLGAGWCVLVWKEGESRPDMYDEMEKGREWERRQGISD